MANFEAHLAGGRRLYESQRYERAEEEVRAALAFEPENTDALTLLAQTLQSLSRFEEAEAVARQAILAEPDWFYSYFVLAQILAARNQWGAALQEVDTAIGMEPEVALLFLLKAKILYVLDRKDEALAACSQALALKPDYSFAHELTAQILCVRQDWQGARFHAERALELEPENAEAQSVLGTVELWEGKNGNAEATFRSALSLNPTDPMALSGLTEAQLNRKPWFRVVRWLITLYGFARDENQLLWRHFWACAAPFLLLLFFRWVEIPKTQLQAGKIIWSFYLIFLTYSLVAFDCYQQFFEPRPFSQRVRLYLCITVELGLLFFA